MNIFEEVVIENGFIVAFLFVGIVMFLSNLLSRTVNKKIPGVAIAVLAGLILAYFGGDRGIADIPLLAGMALLGGAMMRDFAIVATAMGASFGELRKTGWGGIISLFLGVVLSFFTGGVVGVFMGYTSPVNIATIGAGACTYIVGPVTGTALGASSEVIAISIAAGVVKTIVVTIATPIFANRMGLNNPQTAMVFGGMIGTTSGVAAGLAATDPKLVPYGAMTATFYTGLGVLLCPSILFLLVDLIW